DEVCLDACLRHPTPSVTAVTRLASELAERKVKFRLRTPTIVRPEDRRDIEKWLKLDVSFLSGHLGLIAELARAGRNVTADYAVNVFNAHSAVGVFRHGAKHLVLSVELTARQMAEVVQLWTGAPFDAVG